MDLSYNAFFCFEMIYESSLDDVVCGICRATLKSAKAMAMTKIVVLMPRYTNFAQIHVCRLAIFCFAGTNFL